MSGLRGTLARWALQGGMQIELALSGLAERRIVAGDHEIVYLDHRTRGGPGDHGVPIVMLHGFGGDRFNWIRYARHLTEWHRVVIPDLPGFGDSARDQQATYSIENQTTWFAEFLDAVGIDRLHLAGNSMGGHIATHFAARFPHRVETLILHAPAGTEGAGPPWDLAKLERGRHPMKIYTSKDFDELMRWIFVKPPLMVGPVRRFLAARAIANQPFLQKVFADIMQPDEGNALVEPLLPAMTAPTLIIWGNRDRLLDCDEAGTYQRLMPNARVFILRDCGHLPMAERPRQTARLTRDFLEATCKARRPASLSMTLVGG